MWPQGVAPLAGAWIETDAVFSADGIKLSSHPLRVRGLKHSLLCVLCVDCVVAPLAGAWIET